MWITIGVFAGLLVIDQVVKILVDSFGNEGTVFFSIPNFLSVTKTYNDGAAWGMMDKVPWLLVLISLAASVFLCYLCIKKCDWVHGKLGAIALCMAASGCVGNLIDRFLMIVGVREGVVDMISFHPFDWFMGLFGASASIFNVADAFLVVGLILFCVDYFFFYEKRVKKYGLDD